MWGGPLNEKNRTDATVLNQEALTKSADMDFDVVDLDGGQLTFGTESPH